MGCTSSKLDDLPAVELCRERCGFLDEAIRQRYALAEAHVAYIHSLKLIGQSLHNFIEHDFGLFAGSSAEPSSPKLNLPPLKKGDPLEDGPSSPKKPDVSHHSHSNSGSHIQFHSDSEDDDSGSHSLHRSDHPSPLHSYEGGHIEYPSADYLNYTHMGQEPVPLPSGFMHMSFMRNKATPSVVYEQTPMSPETMRMEIGESSSSSYYPYSYTNNNPGPNSYLGNYSYFNNHPSYGSSSPPPSTAVDSKPPPPPPSPPSTSAWDFLNPFESYDKYYPPYTSSRDFREVREEEGIPDLEDYDYQQEVVKEVRGDQKFVENASHSKSPVDNEMTSNGKVLGTEAEASLYQTRPGIGMENGGLEFEVHVVEKKVVNDERSEERGNGAGGGPRNVFEVAREIEVQFGRASESGNEIAKMLEVGKLPYQRKHISSKMLHVVTPSLSVVSSQPSISKAAGPSSSPGDASPSVLDFPEDITKGPKNLSSTLHKLYLWEKKLYNEVKAEEKMRVVHERKCRKLKRLDEKGAEPHKVDSTRTLIRSLSTQIRIAIQVVDKISMKINKIRDEELWPQLNELIQGLNTMWKSMLECHRCQCEAIRVAKILGSIGSGKMLSDTHLEATLQLKHDLLNWTSRFSSWVGSQKGYVRALNNWLLKCLLYEPETTEDGIVPFSPGRIGAPPVFVICHQWSQALDRISEKEVVDSMQVATGVLQCWEQDKIDIGLKMMANKDLERRVRNFDREDERRQKEIQALDKKIMSVDGNSLSVTGRLACPSDTRNSSLQGCLQHIFEAMERFTAESLKAYGELLQRAEEVVAPEHERVL
ncbi:hypothetical protein SLE2022_144700 [Rubroshorea leprosula]